MDLNHLNLRVADPERAQEFYRHWFGFRPKLASDGAVFLTNDDRFLLALFPAEGPSALPPGFHFGFLLDDATAVRDLHQAMSDGGACPQPLEDFEDYVTFRCADLDGHEIEIFWEP